MIEAIGRKSLSHSVADRMIDYIIQERLKPGEKLPSERELIKQLKISRLPLREALARLQTIGVIEVIQGKGMFVKLVDAGNLVKHLTSVLMLNTNRNFFHTMEFRKAIESQTVVLACQHREESDLEKLSDFLKEMRTKKDDTPQVVRADMNFHRSVAVASKNPIFPIVLDTLWDLVKSSQNAVADLKGAKNRAIRYHQTIFDGIKDRDETKAKKAMLAHLNDIGRTVKKYYEARADEKNNFK